MGYSARQAVRLWLAGWLAIGGVGVSSAGRPSQAAEAERVVHADFDVVIAGGSTAAFAAAIAAAESGARTALIEPTD
nr:FAD-dependent oxidoreductase [Pirellulales bacterium]